MEEWAANEELVTKSLQSIGGNNLPLVKKKQLLRWTLKGEYEFRRQRCNQGEHENGK